MYVINLIILQNTVHQTIIHKIHQIQQTPNLTAPILNNSNQINGECEIDNNLTSYLVDTGSNSTIVNHSV
jgi:hypothetical protein